MRLAVQNFFFRGQELCFYLRFATNPSLNHAPVACLNIFQAWAPVIGALETGQIPTGNHHRETVKSVMQLENEDHSPSLKSIRVY